MSVCMYVCLCSSVTFLFLQTLSSRNLSHGNISQFKFRIRTDYFGLVICLDYAVLSRYIVSESCALFSANLLKQFYTLLLFGYIWSCYVQSEWTNVCWHSAVYWVSGCPTHNTRAGQIWPNISHNAVTLADVPLNDHHDHLRLIDDAHNHFNDKLQW